MSDTSSTNTSGTGILGTGKDMTFKNIFDYSTDTYSR